jgi:superfamily II DNA/RNA helicase
MAVAMFLLITSFLGGIGFLIYLVISLFARKPKKIPLLGFAICFVVFIVGAIALPPTEEPGDTSTARTIISAESSETAKAEKAEKKAAEEKAAKEKAEREKEEEKAKKEAEKKKAAEEIAAKEAAEKKAEKEKAAKEKAAKEKAAKEKAKKAAAEKKAEKAKAAQQQAEKEESSTVPLSQAVSLVETSVKKTYGKNYRINYDDQSVTIQVWQNNASEEAVAAANGDAGSLKSWSKLVSGAKKYSSSMRAKLSEAGYPGMSVKVDVLNDLNRDNVLFTAVNGSETYNWVDTEMQKLAAQAARTQPSSQKSEVIVYLPEKGECYHNEDCRTLADYKEPVTLGEAISRGYRPCGVCDPPS